MREAVATAPIKVLIADDHPVLIAGIRRALERSDAIEVVGEARLGAEVLELIERRRPQLVLLDLWMPGGCGFERIKTIREQWPEVKVVVLSADEDRAAIDAALDAGAAAYVVKSVNLAEIAPILRQAACGHVFHATARGPSRGDLSRDAQGLRLTERERTILDAVAAGLTTAAISKKLWVSEHTVKFHLTNIYRKLGVLNRAGAIRYALENRRAAA
jgi:DNA-binding NarL/FixJ family response regulator